MLQSPKLAILQSLDTMDKVPAKSGYYGQGANGRGAQLH